MKSVYLESSVISYMAARPSRDIVTSARQSVTREWWESYRNSFRIFISELVLEEIATGDLHAANNRLILVKDIPVLIATENAIALSDELILKKAIPASSMEDALHIGIAAVQGIDFLLTWNFKHINNANTRDKIAQIIQQANFHCPILCSPEELNHDR